MKPERISTRSSGYVIADKRFQFPEFCLVRFLVGFSSVRFWVWVGFGFGFAFAFRFLLLIAPELNFSSHFLLYHWSFFYLTHT